MGEIKVYSKQTILGKEFTIYGDVENPRFLAKEVAEWIEYNSDKVGQMLKTVDEDEKESSPIHYSGQVRSMWFLTEDGMYEVLMQSRKPIAKVFKKKVKEIMKDVRKHGMYMTDNLLEQTLNNPDFMIQVLTNYKEEKRIRLELENKIEEQKPLVTFAETCTSSEDSILIRELAKLITEQGVVKIGERKLYEKLREWGLILKGKTEPSQRGMNMDLFEVIQRPITKGGVEKLTFTTKVLPKGQVYIIDRLKNEGSNKVIAI